MVPGTLQPIESPDEVRALGEQFGYPLAIKAVGGGGGRGGLGVQPCVGDVGAGRGIGGPGHASRKPGDREQAVGAGPIPLSRRTTQAGERGSQR